LIVTASFGWGKKKEQSRTKRIRAAALRGVIALAVVIVLIGGALVLSGPEVSRVSSARRSPQIRRRDARIFGE